MKNKYNKYMDSIVMTPEMEDRILNKLRDIDNESPKVISIKSRFAYKKFAVAAVILIAVLIGKNFNSFIPSSTDPKVTVSNPIVEYSSFEKFNDVTDYDVAIIENIPFDVEATSYYVYSGSMSEIVFERKDNSLVFRMDESIDDISGDYNVYDDVVEKSIDNNNVIFKGNDGLFNLAIWNDGKYSYSVSFENGIAIDDFVSFVDGF